ncbi:hypothetical protein CC79DRAFT_165087 [Sarocladium strictum]
MASAALGVSWWRKPLNRDHVQHGCESGTRIYNFSCMTPVHCASASVRELQFSGFFPAAAAMALAWDPILGDHFSQFFTARTPSLGSLPRLCRIEYSCQRVIASVLTFTRPSISPRHPGPVRQPLRWLPLPPPVPRSSPAHHVMQHGRVRQHNATSTLLNTLTLFRRDVTHFRHQYFEASEWTMSGSGGRHSSVMTSHSSGWMDDTTTTSPKRQS